MNNIICVVAAIALAFTACKENSKKPEEPGVEGPTVDQWESVGEMMSIYNTSPESPDGKRFCYVSYNILSKGNSDFVKARVMLQERATGKEKVLREVLASNHDGANAIWIDDTTIAFQTESMLFEVVNAATGKLLFGSIIGGLPHRSYGGIIYFSRDRISTTRKYSIWKLDTKTGKTEMIVSTDEICNEVMKQNPSIRRDYSSVQIIHVDPNPSNTRIAFDLRFYYSNREGYDAYHVHMKSNGTDITVLKERPMHALWYDDDSFFGVCVKNDPRNRVYRYNLVGDRLELLAGTSTHVGMSPDRQWFASESGYYRADPDGYTRVYLYRSGNETPVALLSEWKNDRVVWEWRAHVSTAFSDDGERLYFVEGDSDFDTVRVRVVNMKDIVVNE